MEDPDRGIFHGAIGSVTVKKADFPAELSWFWKAFFP